MKILNRGILDDFKRKHADAQANMDSWEAEAKDVEWSRSRDVKQKYPSASILDKKNVVFDIKGNKYRLWVQIAYNSKIIFIKKAGTHNEYMKWKIN